MNRILVLSAFLCVFVLTASFGISPDDFKFAYGQWDMEGNRLVQSDLDAGMARVDIPYSQNGIATYEFNVQYRKGGEDDQHAGLGMHLFVDKPAPGKAWGNGKSYLLWLNYDANADGISTGLSAQVYKSLNHSQMKLVADFDLNKFAPLLVASNMDLIIPVKIVVNGITGDVKVYDPTVKNWVYEFNLGNSNPLSGNYVSLRTNSASFSFGM